MCVCAVFVAVRHGARVSFHGRSLEGLMRLRNAPGLRGGRRPLSGPGTALGRCTRPRGQPAGRAPWRARPARAVRCGKVTWSAPAPERGSWSGRGGSGAAPLPFPLPFPPAPAGPSALTRRPGVSCRSWAPQTANWVVSSVATFSSIGFVASFSSGPLTLY